MPGERKRPLHVLLLFSNTGGGHRAAAEAIRQDLLRRNEQHQVTLEDVLLEHSIWPLTQSDRLYLWAVNTVPWAWRWFYSATAYRRVYSSLDRSLGPIVGRQFRRIYDRTRPDLVVSVHPAFNHLPYRILRQWEYRHGRSRTPFATVITDLTTFHPSWVNPRVNLVATEQARQNALRLGARLSRVRLLGLPVREAFRQPPVERAALRRALGLHPSLPLVLVMGGGQGMGPVEEIARAVAAARPQAQMAVVAGRNQALYDRLDRHEWPIPTRVLGFVQDIHHWMGAADMLITKAGPGTIAEALICGLPILLYGYVPGQEEGNVAFVIEQGVGAYVPDATRIARRVVAWLAEPAALTTMGARARSLAYPRATVDIVDTLLELVREWPLQDYTRRRPRLSRQSKSHAWLIK